MGLSIRLQIIPDPPQHALVQQVFFAVVGFGLDQTVNVEHAHRRVFDYEFADVRFERVLRFVVRRIEGARDLALALVVDAIAMRVAATRDAAHHRWSSTRQQGIEFAPAPVGLDRVKLDFGTVLAADDAHDGSQFRPLPYRQQVSG